MVQTAGLSTRDARVAERKRKQEALEAAKSAPPSARKEPRRDEIALCSDHLTCPICREILENAVETSCAHVYCENCVAIQIANGHKKCAVCRAAIRTSDLRPCVPIRRIVADMDTTCTNAECKWKGTRGNLQDHELMCGYTEVACEYGHDKCGPMRRMDLKKHHVSECLYFICKCTLGCGQSFPRRDLSKHKKACPNARAKCERCAQQVRRKDLPHHNEHVCPKSKVSCFAGCKGKMLREQLGGHILSNLGPHLCALATSARIADQDNKKMLARIAEQERAMAAMAETVAELKAEAAGAQADEDEEGEDDDDDDAAEDAADEDDDDDDNDDDDEDEDEDDDGSDDVDADGSGAGATSSADGSSSADSSAEEEADSDADEEAGSDAADEAEGDEEAGSDDDDADSSDPGSAEGSGSGDDSSQEDSEGSGGQYLLRLADATDGEAE